MRSLYILAALASTAIAGRKAKIYFYPTAACQGGYFTCEVQAGQCCNVLQPYSAARLDDPPGASNLDLYGYRGCGTYGVTGLIQFQCHEPFASMCILWSHETQLLIFIVFSAKWHDVDYDPLSIGKRDAEPEKQECARPSHVTIYDDDGTEHVIRIPKRHYEEVENAMFAGDYAKIKALVKAPRRLA